MAFIEICLILLLKCWGLRCGSPHITFRFNRGRCLASWWKFQERITTIYKSYHSYFRQFWVIAHFLKLNCSLISILGMHLIYSMTLTEKIKSCQLIHLRDDQISKSHFWVYLWELFQVWLNPEDSDLRNSLIHLWILYLNELFESGKLKRCLEELLGIVFEEYILPRVLPLSLNSA